MQAFLNFDRLTSLDERYWVIDGVTVFRRVKLPVQKPWRQSYFVYSK